MTTIAHNPRAKFDYELLDTYDAGIVLFGHEVKSVKTGHISLKGAFVTASDGELFLTNAMIPLYPHAGKIPNYDPSRSRKLLLNKHEIRTLLEKNKTAGLTMVPIRVYIKGKHIKVAFALARGKKEYDKRHTIKKRDADRTIARALRAKH